MATPSLYLVPLDFSRGSLRAFDYALSLVRATKGKLVALHVAAVEPIYPPTGGRFDFYALLERDAREDFRKLAKRKKLKPEDCQFIVARGTNFAEVIARQAKKMRAAMIVMGSHGRTGLPAVSSWQCGRANTSLRGLPGAYRQKISFRSRCGKNFPVRFPDHKPLSSI